MKSVISSAACCLQTVFGFLAFKYFFILLTAFLCIVLCAVVYLGFGKGGAWRAR